MLESSKPPIDESGWISIRDVPDLCLKLTGRRPSRQLVYHWIKKAKVKLRVHPTDPFKTRRIWVIEFLVKNGKTKSWPIRK